MFVIIIASLCKRGINVEKDFLPVDWWQSSFLSRSGRHEVWGKTFRLEGIGPQSTQPLFIGTALLCLRSWISTLLTLTKKDQPSVAFCVFVLHAELANSCLLNYCVVWKVNKLWSWRRRLLKLHWKWIRSPGMAGFSTRRKQHQLSLCAQTVESCRRPVAKIQVLERVWQSHDALGREIPLVGIAPGEWQVSVISFSGFIAQLALALGFCKSHGLEVVFSFLVW